MKTIRGILSHIDNKVIDKIQVCLTGFSEFGFDDYRIYKTDIIWFYEGDIVIDDWFITKQNDKTVLMVFIDDEDYYHSKIEFWDKKISNK